MIQVKNLSISYKDDLIIDNINFNINKGECVLFTGKSGSGKTSIINSINGIGSKYYSENIKGDILIKGKNLMDSEIYNISKIIANVFQNPKTHFFNVNTTLELMFYLENLGFSKEEMDKKLKEMLKIFPIENLLNRDIFKLSGGEKQILTIASCYMSGLDIIILDEPSSNLDDKFINILSNMLKILKDKGISLIISEHRIYYLKDIIDTIYLVDNKKINKISADKFLSFNNDQLVSYGLRSVNKPVLKSKEFLNEGEFEIKKLTCSFLNKEKILIENLAFKQGKIYGIVGYNGCGKTSLLHSLLGISKRSRELILFNGKKISKRKRLRNSSYVAQDVNYQLYTDEVLKEVSLGIKHINKENIEKVLKELDIYKYKNKHPFALSGGEKQRTLIANTSLKDNKFIYFDEPTSGMDLVNMQRISNLIKEISNENNIILIVSHDIEFLNNITDYIVNLEKYRISK